MANLIFTIIVVCVMSGFHSLVLTICLSSNMGDFWPMFCKIAPFNLGYYLVMDWVIGYLKGERI